MKDLDILTADGKLLFTTRIARLFSYGFLSVVLVLYLVQVGLTEAKIGLLLTLTLVGDTFISLWLTTNADRLGRKRMLIVGAALMVFAGVLFTLTGNFILLLVAATIGVISPSGYEVGPFLAIEQASLTQVLPGARRTQVFAWYNLVGSFATALGSLCGGGLSQAFQNAGIPILLSYRVVIVGYALMGIVLAVLFSRLSSGVEVSTLSQTSSSPSLRQNWLGLHRSRPIVLRLAGLFSLDAFAGGFVVQSSAPQNPPQKHPMKTILPVSGQSGANDAAPASSAGAMVRRRFGLVWIPQLRMKAC